MDSKKAQKNGGDKLCDFGICHRKPEVDIEIENTGIKQEKHICKPCLHMIIGDLDLSDDVLKLTGINGVKYGVKNE